ncbi:DUF1993 family protein [Rhizobacter fulvus]
MGSNMYIQSVPVFKQMLNAVKSVLAKTEAHASAHAIEPDAYLQSRLFTRSALCSDLLDQGFGNPYAGSQDLTRMVGLLNVDVLKMNTS